VVKPPCVADFVGKPPVFHTFLYVYRVNPYPKAIDTFFQPLKPIQKPLSNHSFCTSKVDKNSPPQGPQGAAGSSAPSAPGATNPQMGPGHAAAGGWGWRLGYHFIPD